MSAPNMPVSYEFFIKHIKQHEKYINFIFDFFKRKNPNKLQTVDCNTPQGKEWALKLYYKNFYLKPALRSQCPIEFKAVPKSVRDKILQFPNKPAAAIEPINDPEECQLNPLDSNEQNDPQPLTPPAPKPRIIDIKGNDLLPFKSSCPLTVKQFQYYTNIEEAVRDKYVPIFGNQKFNEMLSRIVHHYWMIFYLKPEYRTEYPLSLVKVKENFSHLRKKVFTTKLKNVKKPNVAVISKKENINPAKDTANEPEAEDGEHKALSQKISKEDSDKAAAVAEVNPCKNVNNPSIVQRIMQAGEVQDADMAEDDCEPLCSQVNEIATTTNPQNELPTTTTQSLNENLQTALVTNPETLKAANKEQDKQMSTTVSNSPSTLKFPVTYEEFKKHTYYKEVVDKIIKEKCKDNAVLYEEMKNNKQHKESALKTYYTHFYCRPEIREKCPIRFKPMPKKMKGLIFQLATTDDCNNNANRQDCSNSDKDKVEPMQVNNDDDPTPSISATRPTINEINGNDLLPFKKSCPMASKLFQLYTNIEEALKDKYFKRYGKEKFKKFLPRLVKHYWLIFYLKPEYRTEYPLSLVKVKDQYLHLQEQILSTELVNVNVEDDGQKGSIIPANIIPNEIKAKKDEDKAISSPRKYDDYSHLPRTPKTKRGNNDNSQRVCKRRKTASTEREEENITEDGHSIENNHSIETSSQEKASNTKTANNKVVILENVLLQPPTLLQQPSNVLLQSPPQSITRPPSLTCSDNGCVFYNIAFDDFLQNSNIFQISPHPLSNSELQTIYKKTLFNLVMQVPENSEDNLMMKPGFTRQILRCNICDSCKKNVGEMANEEANQSSNSSIDVNPSRSQTTSNILKTSDSDNTLKFVKKLKQELLKRFQKYTQPFDDCQTFAYTFVQFKQCFKIPLKKILNDIYSQDNKTFEMLLKDKELRRKLMHFYYIKYQTIPNFHLKYPLKLKNSSKLIEKEKETTQQVTNELNKQTSSTITTEETKDYTDSLKSNTLPTKDLINKQNGSSDILEDNEKSLQKPNTTESQNIQTLSITSTQLSQTKNPIQSETETDISMTTLKSKPQPSVSSKSQNVTPVADATAKTVEVSVTSTNFVQDKNQSKTDISKETLKSKQQFSISSKSQNVALSNTSKIKESEDKNQSQSDASMAAISSKQQPPVSVKSQKSTPVPATSSRIQEDLEKAKRIVFRNNDMKHSLPYLLRTSFGLKQIITRALFSMTYEEFHSLTYIFEGKLLYTDGPTMQCVYKRIFQTAQVWPLILYITLHDLCEFLKTKKITISNYSTMLEYVSPKFLHWSNLRVCTNFDESVYFDYKKRTGKCLNVNDETLFNKECNDYYNRCWKYEKWIGQMPLVNKEFVKELEKSQTDDCTMFDMSLVQEISIQPVTAQTDAPMVYIPVSQPETAQPNLEKEMPLANIKMNTSAVSALENNTSSVTPQQLTLGAGHEENTAIDNNYVILPNTQQQIAMLPNEIIVPDDPLQHNLSQNTDNLDDSAEVVSIGELSDVIKQEPIEKKLLTNLNFYEDENGEIQGSQYDEEIVNLDDTNTQIEEELPPSQIDFNDAREFQSESASALPTSGDSDGSSLINLGQRLPSSAETNETPHNSQTISKLTETNNQPLQQPNDDTTNEIPKSEDYIRDVEEMLELLMGDENSTNVNSIMPQPQSDDLELVLEISDESDENVDDMSTIINNQNVYDSNIQQLKHLPSSMDFQHLNETTSKQQSFISSTPQNVTTIMEAQRFPSTFEESQKPPENLQQNNDNFIKPAAIAQNREIEKNVTIRKKTKNIQNLQIAKIKPLQKTSEQVTQRQHHIRPLPAASVAQTASSYTNIEEIVTTPSLIITASSSGTSSSSTTSSNEEHVPPQPQSSLRANIHVSQELTTDCTVFNNSSLLRIVDNNYPRKSPTKTVSPKPTSAETSTPTQRHSPRHVRKSLNYNQTDSSIQPPVTRSQLPTPPLVSNLPVATRTRRSSLNQDNNCKVITLTTPSLIATISPTIHYPRQQIIHKIYLYRDLNRFHYFKELSPQHIATYLLPFAEFGKSYFEATISGENFKTRLCNTNNLALFPYWSVSLQSDFFAVLNDVKEFHFNKFEYRSLQNVEDLRSRILFWLLHTASKFSHCLITTDANNTEFSHCETLHNFNNPSYKRLPFTNIEHAVKPSLLFKLKGLKRDLKSS